MNANYQPPMLLVKDWLKLASKQLSDAHIQSAQLDAEIILSHTLNKPRTYLHAHGDDTLSPRMVEIANARIDLRSDMVPVAYIIGHKEFYGRNFRVNTSTLVPRPESEDIINLLKKLIPPTIYHLPSTTMRLVDVGTGCGCLGITAKLEFPKLEVTLSDISPHALKVAKQNADLLNADVNIIQSDLLASYPFTPDVILANLPYVDPEWERSPETNHEPPVALFAADEGLAIINKLISQAASSQKLGGTLIIEADPVQHAQITSHAKNTKYQLTDKLGYILAFKKQS